MHKLLTVSIAFVPELDEGIAARFPGVLVFYDSDPLDWSVYLELKLESLLSCRVVESSHEDGVVGVSLSLFIVPWVP